jgi:hypothetical protein
MENEEDGRSGRAIVKSDIIVTPKGESTLEDITTALENSDNYGMYLSNLRNINKFIQDEFRKTEIESQKIFNNISKDLKNVFNNIDTTFPKQKIKDI